MAFSGVTLLGVQGTETGAGNPVITTTSAASAGQLVLVLIAKDNAGTASSTASEITSVTDSAGGNTWRSVARHTIGGSAGSTAYADLWFSVLTNGIASGGTITVAKSTDVDCAVAAYKVSIGASNTVIPVFVDTPGGAADPPASTSSGLASEEHLHVRVIAAESETTTGPTATTNWTAIAGTISTSAGGATANIRLAGEYRINTSTGETSDPTLFSADNSGLLVAFKETSTTFVDTFLLHFDGADGSTTFTDSGPSALTVTPAGNAQIDTAQSVFGGASGLFDGTGDYLDASNPNVLKIWSNDFTIDFRFRTTNVAIEQWLYNTNVGGDFYIALNTSGQPVFVTSSIARITGSALSANTWYHCALTRSGRSTRLFIDGSQVGSTYTDDNVYNIGANGLLIGAEEGGGHALNGWIDELRVRVGEAVWTANFTPPSSAYGDTGLSLTPSLFTNSQTFFAPTITTGAVSVAPSLFTNSQTFFAPTVLATYSLTPSLFDNSQSFFVPDVVGGPAPEAQTIAPKLFSQEGGFYRGAFNEEAFYTGEYIFYAPTVAVGAQTLSPSLFTNTQSFFAPTITTGAVTVAPSLFTNTQTFFAPTITAGAVTLTPALFTNTQTFFAPTLTVGTVTLTPSLFTNTQTFFAPAITTGAVTLTPALFTNTQTFFAPTITVSAVTVAPSLFTNTQTFFAPTVTVGAVTLTPDLFTNTQTFFAPTLTATATLSPSLFTNDQTFFAPVITATATIAPSLFTNDQTFFAPTVTVGTVAITPSLFTNEQTFHAPALAVQGGPQALTPSLFTNDQSFFAPTITVGAVTVSPSLFTNDQTFFAPVITATATIAPSLFTNTQTFFAPTVTATATIAPSLFTNEQSFFAPTITTAVTVAPSLFTNDQTFFAPVIAVGAVTVAPSLFTNDQTFFMPAIAVGGGPQALTPSLFTNAQSFFEPTITTGAVTVSPDLFTNDQTFFAPTITVAGTIAPELFINTQTYFAPTITTGVVDVSPSLFTNTQTFFAPTVSVPAAQNITPSLFINTQIFYQPILVIETATYYGIGHRKLEIADKKRQEQLKPRQQRLKELLQDQKLKKQRNELETALERIAAIEDLLGAVIEQPSTKTEQKQVIRAVGGLLSGAPLIPAIQDNWQELQRQTKKVRQLQTEQLQNLLHQAEMIRQELEDEEEAMALLLLAAA